MIEYISNLCKRISSFLRRESVYYAPASKIKEWSFGILDKGIWKYFEKNFFPGGVELIIRNREGLNNYRTEPLPILSRGPTLSDSSNHSERRGLEEKIEIKNGFNRAINYLNDLSSEALTKINFFEFSFSPKYSRWDARHNLNKVNFSFGY